MNLAQVLHEKALSYGAKPAVVFEGKSYSYAEIDRQVALHATVLRDLGVGAGDRVAFQLTKRMEFVFLHLANLTLGGITLPLNSDYRIAEVEYFLSDSGSRLFVTDAERYAQHRETLARLGVAVAVADPVEEPGATGLPERVAAATPLADRSFPAQDDDVAMICYTSGTTGRSKGAMITHRNLVSNMTDLHRVWQWSDRDVLLHVLPLFHVHGLLVALHGGLNAGATVLMHERFDPARTWDTLGAERCTLLMGVPTVYQRLMNEWDARPAKPDLSSVRVFISGSAPLSANLFRRFEEATGFRILERYGMTETGMNTSNPYDPQGRKPGSVGYPLPSVRVRIATPEGKDVAPGEVGEVLLRGDNVFKGYWGMPEKTRESFVDGWFRSGDLGYQDPEDGSRLYLVGRAKELIITGGYNVYPKKVETVLETHPAVRECAVVGLPDEDFGERVTGVVVLKDGVERPAPEELVALCKERLAGYKCPKEIRYIDALPRNAMGKIQKNRLVEKS